MIYITATRQTHTCVHADSFRRFSVHLSFRKSALQNFLLLMQIPGKAFALSQPQQFELNLAETRSRSQNFTADTIINTLHIHFFLCTFHSLSPTFEVFYAFVNLLTSDYQCRQEIIFQSNQVRLIDLTHQCLTSRKSLHREQHSSRRRESSWLQL